MKPSAWIAPMQHLFCSVMFWGLISHRPLLLLLFIVRCYLYLWIFMVAATGKLALSNSFTEGITVLACLQDNCTECRNKCYLFIMSTLRICSWFWYLRLLHNAAVWTLVPGADWTSTLAVYELSAHDVPRRQTKPQRRESDRARCKVCIHWSWIIVPQTPLIIKACFDFCCSPQEMEKTSFPSYISLTW